MRKMSGVSFDVTDKNPIDIIDRRRALLHAINANPSVLIYGGHSMVRALNASIARSISCPMSTDGSVDG